MTRGTTIGTVAVAAGAVAAGLAGRAIRRRPPAFGDGAWAPPPQDLGTVEAFDGTELAVRAAGPRDAPVLLFSHGFSLDMTAWREQWADLADDFRCIAFDHRAHGRSGLPASGEVTIRSIGRDLATVLHAVSSAAPVVLVGHSIGAIAILELADQRPDLLDTRVAGAALFGASASDLRRSAMGSVTQLLRPRLGSLAAAARRVDRVRRAVLAAPRDVPAVVARLTQFAPEAPDELVDHVLRLAADAPSLVWTEGLAAMMSMDLRHALPRVTMPVLVAVGDQDRVTPPAAAIQLAAALPDGHLLVVEGAGHLPMLERPERVNPALRAFARGVLGLDRGKGAA